MKFVKLEEFLTLPAGTLFHKYEPQSFGPLEVFEGPFGGNDFVSEPVSEPQPEGAEGSDSLADLLYLAEKTRASFPLVYGDNASRDGMFDQEQVFAVYEREDTVRLIAFLCKQVNRLPE